MTAPAWIESAVAEFGKSAGLRGFALDARGSAALRFENGMSLRFEYTGAELVVETTVRNPGTPGALKRLLSLSHPKSPGARMHVRAGVLPRSGDFVLAVRLKERDATLPQMNAAFAALWRMAAEAGGAA